MNWNLIIAALLLVCVSASASGIVYTKHKSRTSFIQLQNLHYQRDYLNTEWGRLQLEQSTWATHGRIEKIARNKLGMVLAKSEEIVVLKP